MSQSSILESDSEASAADSSTNVGCSNKCVQTALGSTNANTDRYSERFTPEDWAGSDSGCRSSNGSDVPLHTEPETEGVDTLKTPKSLSDSKGKSVSKSKRDEQICSFFVKTGRCRYGKNCRYLHPIKSKPKEAITKPKAKQGQDTLQTEITTDEDCAAVGDDGGLKCSESDLSTSSSSKPTCKFFERSGWCRFGYRCRFSHVKTKPAQNDHDKRRDAPSMGKYAEAPPPASESASSVALIDDGELVSEASHLSVSDAPSEIGRNRGTASSLSSSKEQLQRVKVCHFYEKGKCRMGRRCRFLHVHEAKDEGPLNETHSKNVPSAKPRGDEGDWQPARKPVSASSLLSRPLADLKDGDAAQMRETEISQLKKRYPGDRLVVGTAAHGDPSYRFTVNPTDPDWPYDLRDFEIEVVFSKEYPIAPLQLCLPEDQVLPSIILRYISEAIREWLEARYATNEISGRVELVIRPFLRWFDRSLMRLFTEGARKFKKEVCAKAAGFEFISYAKNEADESASQPDQGDTDAPAHPKEEFINLEMDGRELDDMNDVDEEVEEEEDGVEDREERESAEEGEYEDDYNEGQEFPQDQASGASESLSTTGAQAGPGGSANPSRYESPMENRRGTEIRLMRLELSESAAVLACQRIKLRVQCARCREQTDLSVSPGRALILGCHKCQNQQSVGFRPCLVHQFSSVLGFLDLTGCASVDLIMYECQFLLNCLECSSDTNVQGIQYGQSRLVWCIKCHQKMSVSMETARFQKLVASVPEGKKEVISVKKERRLKDPAIREGFPLLANGTCKHYKKSFRWLRFPCCGKCYPCDECHDLAEMDHEMIFASRMICGFCSKEQHFSVDKPCIGCGSSTTKSKTPHWEGGTGCRNRTKMSKTDKQKYSGVNKTTSRKAQKVEDFKKGIKKKK